MHTAVAFSILLPCSLQSQLNQQSADVSQQVQNQVTLAANTHFEEHLQHLEQERLGPLVQAELRRQVQQVRLVASVPCLTHS